MSEEEQKAVTPSGSMLFLLAKDLKNNTKASSRYYK